MRPAVTGRAVLVAPPVVRGQQVVERGEQVVVAAGAGLDDRDAGGGVRDEDVQQAVAAVRDVCRAVRGEVEHSLGAARAVGPGLGVHAPDRAIPG